MTSTGLSFDSVFALLNDDYDITTELISVDEPSNALSDAL